MRLATTAAVVAVALAVTLTGCRDKPAASGSPSTTARAADTLEVEELLVSTQKRATPDLDVRDATCPARVVVTQNAEFQCTMVVEGIVVPYKVTLLNVDNPSRTGRYDIRPAKAVILMPKVVETLSRANPNARVDCGPEKVRVLEPGQTMRCVVTSGGTSRVVTFRVDDVLGTLTPVAE
ncbi:MAG: DUF4333 domain-containing protein [Acidimicrobiales bacterium]